MKAVYVLALTGRAIPAFTVDKHRVEFIDLGGVYAAIEHVTERPTTSESALRIQHDIVMRLFDRIEDVVPARFGTLIEERELRDVLAARQVVIQDALALVRGRVQMTVRFRNAPESMPARNPSTATGAMSGTAYLEARRTATRTMPVLAGVVSTAVAELTVAERSEPASERAPATLYHLIDRNRVARYSHALSKLQSPAVSVSGPWPPFAFAPDLWP